MTDAAAAETTTTTTAGEGTAGEAPKEQSFSQADVEKIVRDRLAQQAKNKFGDYDALKATAEGAKTVEQKLSDLEKKHADAEARALRSEIAATHGISKEDRDLFLTGSDEATLTAQAQRLAARDTERIAASEAEKAKQVAEEEAAKKAKENVAPKEGATTTKGSGDEELREFARSIFGAAD